MESVLGRRKGTGDDYVLRAKIRWALGMVRRYRYIDWEGEVHRGADRTTYPKNTERVKTLYRPASARIAGGGLRHPPVFFSTTTDDACIVSS